MSGLQPGKLILHGLKKQYLRLKLQFSLSHREADFQEGEHLFGAGLLLACKTHLVAPVALAILLEARRRD